MRFHSQNLNELPGNREGSIFRHGRCWLDWLEYDRFGFSFEWTIFKKSSTGITLELATHDDAAIRGMIGFFFFAFYWAFKNRRLRVILDRFTSRESKPRELDQCWKCNRKKADHGLGPDHLPGHQFTPRTYWMTNGRTIGIRWFEGILWIDLWNDPMESRSVDPKWWHTAFCPVDFIFGRTKYEERAIADERVLVPMPEGGYPASVKIYESIWRRSRWPWPWKRMIRSTITPDKPIPFPGKGENSWDCGEDSCHSLSGAHPTAFEAAMALSKSVMRDRVRYGGWQYRPEAMAK